MIKKTVILITVCISYFACKDPFMPDVEAQYKRLLVVEGFINIGAETVFKLSRTTDLQDWQVTVAEKNATVVIEGKDGIRLSASSNVDGTYSFATQNLDLKQLYRLKISTADGRAYETTYLESKQSPEIDDLVFKIENTGFQVYLNTHDNTNNTKYYRWDYSETWELRSQFISYYDYQYGKITPRDQGINITNCWKGNYSSNILLGSSERLSEDRLELSPICYIKGNSEKLAYMYSILVQQYGLTEDAYRYWENLKKNTEKIGSIFDSQPSELEGNIICTSNPNELVIGWVSAGMVSKKRIFISAKEKPNGKDWFYGVYCGETRDVPTDSVVFYMNNNSILTDTPGVSNIGRTDCTDCRLKGSNVRPAYWINKY